jgi:Ca2+-binding EF-hand superfamily protein
MLFQLFDFFFLLMDRNRYFMKIFFNITFSLLFLQEFTCDVSVEGTKQPQPIQFSFTLYDLDGHGKITKDVSI